MSDVDATEFEVNNRLFSEYLHCYFLRSPGSAVTMPLLATCKTAVGLSESEILGCQETFALYMLIWLQDRNKNQEAKLPFSLFL